MPTPTSTKPVALTTNGHDLLFPTLPYNIGARAEQGTANEQVRGFVSTSTRRRDENRKQHCRETFGSNYDAMRDLAGSIKQHALDHLDYYLDQFIDRATQAGTTVHLACDGDQANQICLEIARNQQAKLCVKSKSMVTEEIRLVPALEKIGVETVETDLGEFILQLDHDAPSHIVQPIIHKDRVAVGRTFERELGVPFTDEASQLTKIARKHLRQKYREADLGMSGANFLVAETGSVVICTNEGNGRLCTSVPPVHIVVAGIEKIIPKLEHLGVLLKLLARSATARPMTCYNHIMTGPRRPDEPDGPQQMHIILVDNGRTQILHRDTREMLRCIRCGACLNACPVYRSIGGHAYGAVYSGPIGALITPLFRGLANYKDLPQASSLCGACYEACPVNINIPKYLIQLRRDMIGQRITSLRDRLLYRLWGFSLKYPASYRIGQALQKLMFRHQARLHRTLDRGDIYAARGWLDEPRGPLRNWTSQRSMPTPPAKNFRHWWRQRQNKHG